MPCTYEGCKFITKVGVIFETGTPVIPTIFIQQFLGDFFIQVLRKCLTWADDFLHVFCFIRQALYIGMLLNIKVLGHLVQYITVS